MQNDPLLTNFMGFASLLQGNMDSANRLLKEVANYLPDHAVSKDTMAEDYLSGAVGVEGIKAFFLNVDETRESLLAKRDALTKALEKHPKFKEGLFSLAVTWLQLHRAREALEALNRYHDIDESNPTVEYYLAALNAERFDYNKSWHHLRLAEAITERRDHFPESLLDLRQELSKLCPE